MNFQGIEICCPHCRGDLFSPRGDQSALRCGPCERDYPIIFGIPDLRIFPDPYIGIQEDREKGLKIAAHLQDLDFEGLVTYYYRNTSVVPAAHAQLYSRGLLAAEARSRAALSTWESTSHTDGSAHGRTLLDVGSGTAPLLVAASGRFETVVGVDIAFRWLVVARKRLQEAGVEAPLICACAEALPFPDIQFDAVTLESTLEHVDDQVTTLAECYRCARPDGRLFLSTPNRYSLGPDPQVGIPAGGYLPESWIAAIVRRQGGIPPKRRLLSRRSLKRLILAAGFQSPEIYLPDISSGQKARFSGPLQRMADLYHLAKRAPGGREVLFWIGPLLHAVAEKKLSVERLTKVVLQ